jgi:hypothetical protein
MRGTLPEKKEHELPRNNKNATKSQLTTTTTFSFCFLATMAKHKSKE